MTAGGEPAVPTGRLTCVQYRQCEADPRSPIAGDLERLGEYIAGYADGQADSGGDD
jgi:hypothetical protein